MSKTWKWILGIVLGLAILAGAGFVAVNSFDVERVSIRVGPGFDRHPMMDEYGFGNRAPMEDFRGFRHPMLGGRGFGGYGFVGLPFLFVGGLLRLVFPLAALALVAYFSYQTGKNAGMKLAQARPEPGPVPDAEPAEPPKRKGRKIA
jgi:hypothetical protein